MADSEEIVTLHEAHGTIAPEHKRVIAIPVDASKYSEFAFNWAIKNLVRAETDQIVLLNVRPVATLPKFFAATGTDVSTELDRIQSAYKQQSHELLQSYAAKLATNKYNIRGVALVGDPREQIALKVEEIHADMLVIGSRGLGAFQKVVLGSVSEYLIQHLNIPVIVPRSNELSK
ncbi:hypothetical protein HK100_010994 [Physocladia obscura]|uniref:UspA domain-containing protein n=1 Tax=Physocladia obscura TaxID=109957 RepID=A0AAD5XIL9_9FUNG|nr:hypothetical protein HK100_010994 [Physocladia obscura]